MVLCFTLEQAEDSCFASKGESLENELNTMVRAMLMLNSRGWVSMFLYKHGSLLSYANKRE